MKETLRSVNAARAATIREKVMKLTGLTEHQINHLMFDTAIEYCKTTLGISESWLNYWLKDTIFWNWWRQQWTLVDEVYWYSYSGNLNRENIRGQLQDRYLKAHKSIDKFPDDIVFNKIHNSYEVVRSHIIRKIMAQYEHL